MCRCTVYLGVCDLISLWKKKLEKETYSMYPAWNAFFASKIARTFTLILQKIDIYSYLLPHLA